MDGPIVQSALVFMVLTAAGVCWLMFMLLAWRILRALWKGEFL